MDNVGITLNWDSNTESDLYSYRIYRATLLDTTPDLVGVVLSSTELDYYRDEDIEQNIIYDYYLAAVDNDGNESLFSDKKRTTISDIIAPDTPENISVTFNSSSVTLDWDDNTESDFAGYQVYRSLSETGTYTRQNVNTLTSSTYEDTDVVRTETYHYQVTALDSDSNSSVTSDIQTVAYFPEIESYSVQDGLTIQLVTDDGSGIISTLNYTSELIGDYEGYSGITRIEVELIEELETTYSRYYTRKSGGVLYVYEDTTPYIEASESTETLDLEEFVSDGSSAGYSNDTLEILGFETVTDSDGTIHYVAKAQNLNDSSVFYIGETFLFLGGYTGDEDSPDTTTSITEFTE